MCSLIPRPCTFVTCSTKFTQNFVLQCKFYTASNEWQGLGTRLYYVAMTYKYFVVASLSLCIPYPVKKREREKKKKKEKKEKERKKKWMTQCMMLHDELWELRMLL